MIFGLLVSHVHLLDIQGSSNMTGTEFLNHNCQTLTCTCQSSTYSPPESTHFFQSSGSILMPFSKKACVWRLVYTQISPGHIWTTLYFINVCKHFRRSVQQCKAYTQWTYCGWKYNIDFTAPLSGKANGLLLNLTISFTSWKIEIYNADQYNYNSNNTYNNWFVKCLKSTSSC
jgi:hypothetical protein